MSGEEFYPVLVRSFDNLTYHYDKFVEIPVKYGFSWALKWTIPRVTYHENSLSISAQSNSLESFQLLDEALPVFSRLHSLYKAVSSGNLEVVRYLINKGIILEPYYSTALLRESISKGHLEIFKVLFSVWTISKDKCLEIALENNQVRMFIYFLDKWVIDESKLSQLLYSALDANYVEIAEILLKRGVWLTQLPSGLPKDDQINDLLEDYNTLRLNDLLDGYSRYVVKT